MTKKEFMNFFRDEDSVVISSLYDKLLLCSKTEKCIYSTEFLNPKIWTKLRCITKNMEVNLGTKGISEDSDKKIIAFYKFQEPSSYPVRSLKVTNKSKFKTLEHRDYLGALTSLGIKREKFGDVLVVHNSAYFLVFEDILEYILHSLDKVSNCPCDVEIVDMESKYFNRTHLKALDIITTSLRADCLVSSICNISRSKGEGLITSGKVYLNYEELQRKDKLIETDDTITIRGFGKFKFKEIIGDTQKGRLKVRVEKYL
ncbi:MAG: YlmH/Sll1252 family protein [Clostridium sp.]